MGKPNRFERFCSFDWNRLRRQATVRYRCSPPNQRRAFIANSFKSVTAMVIDLSEVGIGLVLDHDMQPGTPVRIELENSDRIPLIDLAAIILHSTKMEYGKHRCVCEWVRPLSLDELLALRNMRTTRAHLSE